MPARGATPYVILGLLRFGPLSGYQVRAELQSAASSFWSESYGQIYPALRALHRSGCVRLLARGHQPSRQAQGRPRGDRTPCQVRVRHHREGPCRVRGVARRPSPCGAAAPRAPHEALSRRPSVPRQTRGLAARPSRAGDRAPRASRADAAGAAPGAPPASERALLVVRAGSRGSSGAGIGWLVPDRPRFSGPAPAGTRPPAGRGCLPAGPAVRIAPSGLAPPAAVASRFLALAVPTA
jgi:hypothetical protein